MINAPTAAPPMIPISTGRAEKTTSKSPAGYHEHAKNHDEQNDDTNCSKHTLNSHPRTHLSHFCIRFLDAITEPLGRWTEEIGCG